MPAGTSVGRISLDMGLNYKDFKKQMGGIASTARGVAGSAFSKFGVLAAGAFAAGAVAAGVFAKSAISMASSLQEVQNVVDVTFGAMSGFVDAFAKTAGEKFGLSELHAKRFSGTMGAMLKSMGLAPKQIVGMSTALTGLAGDFASFYDIKDPEESFNKIRSGIAGETEGLKQLGINMSNANLESFMLTKGIKGQFSEMTQANQALIRYNYLMKVSADAQGDFTRTSGSWANQVRIMTLRWGEFKAGIGKGLMLLFTPVLKVLNTVLSYLIKVGQVFSMVMERLFGIKQKSTGAAKAVSGIGTSAEKAAEGQKSLAKGTKAAAKAAKASVASFDKLNIIGEEKSDDGGSGGSGGLGGLDSGMGGAFDTGAPSSALDEMGKKVDEFVLKFETAIKKIGTFFTNLYNKELKQPFEQIVTYLRDVVVKGLTDSFQLVLDSALLLGKKALGLITTIAGDIWTSFKENLPAVLGQAEITFTTLNKIFQDGVKVVTDILSGALDVLIEVWDKWGKKTLDNVWKTLLGIWDSFNKILVQWVKPIVDDALKFMKDMWDKHLKTVVSDVLNFIMKLANAAMDLYNGFIKPIVDWLIVVLAPIFKNAFKAILNVLDTAIQFIKEFVGGALKVFGGLIDFIVGIFTGDWKRAWNGVKDIFSGIWAVIKSIFNLVVNLFLDIVSNLKLAFNAARESVMTAFSPIVSWFSGIWDSIKRVFSAVGTWFSGIFAGARDAILDVFDNIGNNLKRPLNSMIDMINNLIRQVNKFHINLPDMLGGGTLGFSIPTIPRLAQGGIVSQPTLAMVGDNKRSPEVIAPLHDLQAMIANSSGASNEKMVEMLKRVVDTIRALELSTEVYIGNELIDDYVEKRKNRKTFRAGRLPAQG